MASLCRVDVEWSGLNGLPGISQHYFSSTLPPLGALNDFYSDLAMIFPNGLLWTIPGTGDSIESTNGELDGSWSTAGGGVVGAGGAGDYASGVGARVRWRTTGITNGRRRVGTTFLVPLTGGAYSASGVIDAATTGLIQTAATALIAAVGSDMVIYHRPVNGVGGAFSAVDGSTVPSKVAILRSRRD